MALALAVESVPPPPPPPPTPIVYDEATLCALVQPSKEEDRLRPLRVYTARVIDRGVEKVSVNACMVGPVRERSGVTVQFQVFDPRLHFWTELGQTACIKPDAMQIPACHDGRWLAGAEWAMETRANLQVDRMPAVLVWVRWIDCDTSPATFDCKGTIHKELYLMPTVELPTIIRSRPD
jgi:hypothetical protein